MELDRQASGCIHDKWILRDPSKDFVADASPPRRVTSVLDPLFLVPGN